MSRALITESYLTGIANAIRTKLGVQSTYTPPQMAAAIESIPTGGITPTGTKNITQNGTHDVAQYASANVNVQPNLQSKTATQNGTVVPDQGYDGLSSVVVNVSGGGGGGDVLCNIDFTKGNLTIGNVTINSSGAVFDSITDWLALPFARAGMTIELDVASMSLTSGTHRRFVMATSTNGFIYRSTGKWALYSGTWEESSITDGSFFDNSTVKIFIDSSNKWHIYKNDVIVWEPSIAQAVGNYYSSLGQVITLGSTEGQGLSNTIITGARIY